MRCTECDIHVSIVRPRSGSYAVRILSVNGTPEREYELYELISTIRRINEIRSFDRGSYIVQKIWKDESPTVSSDRWERALSHIESRHGAGILASMAFSQKLVVSEYAL